MGQQKEQSDQALVFALKKAIATETDNAASDVTTVRFPNVFQLCRAAQVVTDEFKDQAAVTALQEIAPLTRDRGSLDDAEELTAFIGLALLAEKHNTASFLKRSIGDRPRHFHHGLLGISFLPPALARTIAEEMAADAMQSAETRMHFLFLLRALGDEQTLAKMAVLPSDRSPRLMDVRDRTAAVIRKRLGLETAEERERWSRQELVFFQAPFFSPGLRGGTIGLAWTAEQIHRTEPEIAVDLLKARLSLQRPALIESDANLAYEIPLSAAIA